MKLSLKDFTGISNLFAVPILIVDPQSYEVAYCNEYFEELTGKTVDQVKGEEVYDLFVSKSRKKIDAIISLANGEKNRIRIGEKDLEIKRRSGRRSPVDVFCKAVSLVKGKVLVFSLIDLSEVKEKQQEREFLINQNLRSAKLADLGRLAQGIAHELNNPLSVIVGNVDVLNSLKTKQEFSSEIAQKSLASIAKNSQRMSAVVRKLLNFYKTEDVNFKEVSSIEVIREIINESEYYLNYNKISLYIDLTNISIVCDRLYIKQVLANLIKNAITAIESQKTPRMITVKSEDVVGEYVISVNNNGSPMSDEVMNKIFTPFFTTKDVGEGVGLSLYLSEKIMKIHHGSISFESNFKSGTTFFLHFPKSSPNLSVEPEAKVLIVSTETSFRTFLANKLENDNFKIVVAQTLSDSKNYFHHPFSAMVIDASDPGLFKSSMFADLIELSPAFPIILFYPPEFDLKLKFLKMNNLYFYPKPIRKTDYEDMVHLIKERRVRGNKKVS
ncbi:MAG: PAS domain-containing sensor histidine kinase [Bdellovibrionaceae bacterium]|nr:PAS domain-containing sensor histidine kinase [Pseudobdellovibrionaceae bacterium]